ncbi:MAG: hypothetical protein WBF33_01705 [Candidatus Nitrosopolaris sp.]
MVALDGSESAVKAADYALVITKGHQKTKLAIEDTIYEFNTNT